MSTYKFSFKNHNKVPKKQWRKWTLTAKQVFNAVYEQMLADPGLFHHPDADYYEDEFKTTAWNAAWTAADAVDGIVSIELRS